MFVGTAWSLLDMRNLTRPHNISAGYDVSQIADGLHFDRINTHNITEHIAARKEAEEKGMSYPGQFEMQIVQNFLNMIFHEELVELYG